MARVRKYVKVMPIASAVDQAISKCIAEDVLAKFLSKNRAEARKMSIYEYDEEAVKKVWQNEAFSEGSRRASDTCLSRLSDALRQGFFQLHDISQRNSHPVF